MKNSPEFKYYRRHSISYFIFGIIIEAKMFQLFETAVITLRETSTTPKKKILCPCPPNGQYNLNLNIRILPEIIPYHILTYNYKNVNIKHH